MTVSPSTSLHVLPPAQADIKRLPDNPPTPLTPQTSNSAMSSRAKLSEDSTYPPVPQTSPPPDHTSRKSLSDMPADHVARSPSEQAYTSTTNQEGARVEDGGQTAEMPMLGLKCAPPDMLPPSPPLTVADAREEPGQEDDLHAASSSSAGPRGTDAALPHMREEDITEWRVSVHGGRDEEEEDDPNAAEDGEYDPYDLGYSPVTPVGPSAHRTAAAMALEEMTNGRNNLREVEEHPLKFDVHPPPSPPPWEVISPPATNGVSHAQTKGLPPIPSSSRPLIPHSAYYFGPPSSDAAFGTHPVGHIGVHHPREIVRIERDYSGGETVQFAATYPLELEGRITPTQFLETINAINERLIEAHSLRHSLVDNALSFFTLQLSRLILSSHYDKAMERLRREIDEINVNLYNPVGLHILWPREVAFMFLEIEYY